MTQEPICASTQSERESIPCEKIQGHIGAHKAANMEWTDTTLQIHKDIKKILEIDSYGSTYIAQVLSSSYQRLEIAKALTQMINDRSIRYVQGKMKLP